MNEEDTQKNGSFEIEIPFPLFQYLSAEHCNIQFICRICLSESNNELFSLLSSENCGFLHEIYKSTTNIQVCPDDGLPSHICNNCKVQLMNSYEFKIKCLKSDCTLKSLLRGEFYTKEGEHVESLESPKDVATIFVGPTKDSVVTTSEINNGEEIIEDIQYLEDLSGSDTEIMCMVQDTEKICENKQENTPTTTKTNSNKKPKTRVCGFCSKRFKNKKAVTEHMKRIHGSARQPHSCKQCKESYKSDHDLNLHLPVHGPGPTWKCVECSKEFKGRSMFRRHIQRHMLVKRYSCTVCSKPFAELYALRRHSRVHTGEKVEKNHVCHICSNRYSESGLLARHMARHEGSRPCVCAECGKGFASERLLASHHRVHSDTKPHQCYYCDKRFRHESTRNTHHRTHTGEKPYVCAICGKRFIQNSNLTLHMRTHTGEKPYDCQKCGRSFSSGSTLKAHIRTHTGDKPYSCPICGKKFARLDMRTHMRQHTGERPFACAVCARTFVTAARLREHSRIHTGEKPYECNTCHQKFSHRSLLVKHMKVHELQKKPSTSRKVENNVKHEEKSPSMPISSGICEDSGNLQIVNMDDTESRSREELEIKRAVDDSSGCLSSDPICLSTRIKSEEEYPSEMNLVSVSDIEDSGVRFAANALDGNVPVKLYQVDHSLVQIHSSGGQVTIRKFTSKMTTNF